MWRNTSWSAALVAKWLATFIEQPSLFERCLNLSQDDVRLINFLLKILEIRFEETNAGFDPSGSSLCSNETFYISPTGDW